MAPQSIPFGPDWLLLGSVTSQGVVVEATEGALRVALDSGGTIWMSPAEVIEDVELNLAGKEVDEGESFRMPSIAVPSLALKESSGSRGRYMVLSNSDSQVGGGVTLLETAALAAIVSSKDGSRVCHACYGHQPGRRMLRCAGCEVAYYCSRDCMSHDDKHDFLCRHLKHSRVLVSGMKNREGAALDLDIVRLALHVVAETCLLEDDGSQLRQVFALTSHRGTELAADLWQEALGVAELVLSPRELEAESTEDALFGWPVEAFAELLLRLRFNAHPLRLGRIPATILGLFPAACFFNHSCRPNAVPVLTLEARSPAGRGRLILQVRSIREVRCGEEVCVSYLSQLTSTRQERREVLRSSFMFSCKCERCHEERSVGDDQWCCPCCRAVVGNSSIRTASTDRSGVLQCGRQACRSSWLPARAYVAAIDKGERYIGLLRNILSERHAQLAAADDYSKALLRWLVTDEGSRRLAMSHRLRAEAAMILLALGRRLERHDQVAVSANILSLWMADKGLVYTPQSAELLAARGASLLAVAREYPAEYRDLAVAAALDTCRQCRDVYEVCYSSRHGLTEAAHAIVRDAEAMAEKRRGLEDAH